MQRQTVLKIKKGLVGIFLLKIFFIKLSEKTSTTRVEHRKDCLQDFYSKPMDRISADDLIRYLYWSNSSSCRIIHDFGGRTRRIFYKLEDVASDKRIGTMDGQKSVCMDPQLAPKLHNCLVYSFGINDEWSFDEAFQSYGCQVYSFDPSMSVSDHEHSHKVHFYHIGIGDKDVQHDPQSGWKLMTLKSVYRMLESRHGDAVIDYVKLDVESAEWTVVPQIIRSGMLNKVKQLGMEIHFKDEMPNQIVHNYLNVLRSLEMAGMVRFASRANLVADGYLLDRPSFLAFELVWYNSKFYT